MKSLAAILVAQHEPLVLDEIDVPPLGFGQALVQVLCSGICGSQLGEIDGVKGSDRFLPHLLGHEGVGMVLECGEGVSRAKKGRKVVLHWMRGGGIESAAPRYIWKHGTVNAGWVTTFNQYAVVSENRMTPIPDDFDNEYAALMGCAVTTGFGVVNNNARLKIGQSVLVVGVGGVGLSVVQAAALVAGNPIIAVDRVAGKLDLARKLGATHAVHAGTGDMSSAVADIVGRDGVDVAVDTTGNPSVIETVYRLTSPSGRTILVGVPASTECVSIHTLPLHFGKVLTGSHGGESQPDRDIPRYVRLCLSGKLPLRDLITHRFSLCQINDAIESMRRGDITGRCLILT